MKIHEETPSLTHPLLWETTITCITIIILTKVNVINNCTIYYCSHYYLKVLWYFFCLHHLFWLEWVLECDGLYAAPAPLGFLGNPEVDLRRCGSSMTHLLHRTLPVASSNKHKRPLTQSIFTWTAHTHCNNADLLFPCLCNGWVEWAGAHSERSCVALTIIPAASPPYSYPSSTVTKEQGNPFVSQHSGYQLVSTGNASLLPPVVLTFLKEIIFYSQKGGVKMRGIHAGMQFCNRQHLNLYLTLNFCDSCE